MTATFAGVAKTQQTQEATYLGHGHADEGLHAREPVAKRRVEVVGEVHHDHAAAAAGVEAHVVSGIVQELCTHVPAWSQA